MAPARATPPTPSATSDDADPTESSSSAGSAPIPVDAVAVVVMVVFASGAADVGEAGAVSAGSLLVDDGCEVVVGGEAVVVTTASEVRASLVLVSESVGGTDSTVVGGVVPELVDRTWVTRRCMSS